MSELAETETKAGTGAETAAAKGAARVVKLVYNIDNDIKYGSLIIQAKREAGRKVVGVERPKED